MDSNVLPLISASALPVGQADDLPNSSQRDCPFLHMLPLEIRLMIYRYLLVGRNVKQEINMKSHKVCAKSILPTSCADVFATV